MELLVLRHGDAENTDSSGDHARALVATGFEQAKQAGNFVRRYGCSPEIVLTSPVIRAWETAETFCHAAELDPPIRQPWLGCGMHPETAVAEILAFQSHQRVMVVGHEPDLSTLLEFLLGSASDTMLMEKGSLASLELNQSCRRGRLLFLAPPEVYA